MRKIFRTLCAHSGGKTHKEVLALPQGNEITNGGEATNATGIQWFISLKRVNDIPYIVKTQSSGGFRNIV